ncbi:MAG: group I intron-associated PD-(D/E)XK endonuclease [bacterium]
MEHSIIHTGSKGKLAESLVLSELMKNGFHVAIPFGEYRYDFIVEHEGTCHKIQVKYVGHPSKRSTIPVLLHSFSRKGRVRYAACDVDFLIVYYQPETSFYIIPFKDVAGKSAVNLRLKAAGNKQNCGIINASIYKDRWDLLKEPAF